MQNRKGERFWWTEKKNLLTFLCGLFLFVHIVRGEDEVQRWRLLFTLLSLCFSLSQVDSSVFKSRDAVQRLSFGLSFLQRMDMKPVVIMGWSKPEDSSPGGLLAGSHCAQGLVERSKQLTEALQQHSAAVLPLFSAESFLLQQDTQPGNRWDLRISTKPDILGMQSRGR